MRKTQERRGIWLPFPPHPEGRQGPLGGSRRRENKVHAVMETQKGRVAVQAAPLGGFSSRKAHCEDKEDGGRMLLGSNECAQNKGMLKTGNSSNNTLFITIMF